MAFSGIACQNKPTRRRPRWVIQRFLLRAARCRCAARVPQSFISKHGDSLAAAFTARMLGITAEHGYTWKLSPQPHSSFTFGLENLNYTFRLTRSPAVPSRNLRGLPSTTTVTPLSSNTVCPPLARQQIPVHKPYLPSGRRFSR